MPYIGQAGTRPYQDAARIAGDPEYGWIVCHCERVTRGEIRDALASPLPPADIDGLRRRTRVLNGRCQGFYCAATVAALFAGVGPVAAPPPDQPPGHERTATGSGRRAPRGWRSAVHR
jgi:bacterioferritin-associated ferredoxin